MYKATNNETGEVTEMTEAQVRGEIIHMFQHDLGTFETDEEIVAGVNASNLEDYFTDGLCEVANYQITLA
jgi:hypothetical protein